MGGKGGFRYYVSPEKLREYGRWPLERRLAWLFSGNRLRMALPRRILKIQDAFRRGDAELTDEPNRPEQY